MCDCRGEWCGGEEEVAAEAAAAARAESALMAASIGGCAYSTRCIDCFPISVRALLCIPPDSASLSCCDWI